jgi:outer membrane protein OmpA-like peptidoglycan-associated protein/outer membrane protein W
MPMKLQSAALAATIVSLPTMAAAQPLNGLYVGVGAGVNWLQDEHLVGATGTASDAALRSRPGPVGVLSLGYALNNGLRFEIEGDYRDNRFSEGRNLGFPAAAGGSEHKWGAMFNVLYDFSNIIPVPYFAPYAGVGVGYQWAHFDSLHVYGGPSGFPRITSDDTRGALAYQAIIGGAAPISAVPGLAMTVEYRFLGLASRKYDVAATVAPGTAPIPGRQKFGNDFNHAVLIGLRYNFGQTPPPAPAPVAAPAPAPARSYLVFFDWDKATLTDRARQIIKDAADNSTRVQYTRIEVNGYTDTSGTPRYNQGLSVRRAQAVAAELVRDGVPRETIGIQGFGDTHLLVPTGPGVREPQNRRVEIIVR